MVEAESYSTEQRKAVIRSDICKEYYKNASLHGIRFLYLSASVPRRVLWSIVFLISTMGLILTSYLAISDYAIGNHLVYETEQEISSFTFPSVTVCPAMAHSLIKANRALEIREWFKNSLGLTSSSINISKADVLKLTKDQTEEFRFIFMTTQAMSLNESDLIISCSFGGAECIYSTNILTGEKTCLVVTGRQHIGNYPREDSTINIVLKVMDSNDFMPIAPKPYSGFDVILAKEGAYANESQAFLIEAGRYTKVAAVEKKVSTDDLSIVAATRCTDTKLRYFPTYSIDGCFKDCLIFQFEIACGCKWPFVSAPSSLPACSMKEYDYCRNNLTDLQMASCNCNQPCNGIIYECRLSSSALNTETLQRELPSRYRSMSPDDFDKFASVRLAVLRIAMDPQSQSHVKKNMKSPLFSMIGTIGGLLAIFLGCSFLSFFEVIDLVCRLIGEYCDPPEETSAALNKPNQNGVGRRPDRSWSTRSSVMEY